MLPTLTESVSQSKQIAIKLSQVSLDIPVATTETRSLKGSLVRSMTGGKLQNSNRMATISALSNVSCTVYQGERVALIGHNGAGKSTFLRLISGIYASTSGHIEKNVYIHPMINKSLNTSFELSGYQAIKSHYLINTKSLAGFDQFCERVVSFSGLGDFVRLPVKTYSEGMVARLVFSLFTETPYECLAMDEGLGTGDVNFYEKAETRLREFVSSAGTLFLASHSADLLKRFCDRGFVFSEGSIKFDGPLSEALDFHHQNSR